MKRGQLWLKVQVACGETPAIGPGKADLLEAIIAHESITAAGQSLGMSYRRAWTLVDDMNRCFDPPLVETLRGGGRERGARITPTGTEVLAAYREMEQQAAMIADQPAYARLLAHLRTQPVPNS